MNRGARYRAAVLVTAAAALLAGSSTAAADEGRVLNIATSTPQLKTRVISYVPGYEEIDDEHGRIIDADGTEVEVVWRIIEDSAEYQSYLEENLYDNRYMLPDERIDLFMADAGYLRKYTDAQYGVAVPVRELGITEEELADRLPYELLAASDENGEVRALAYKACAAVMVYRRDMAEEVFGSADRETIEERFADLEAMKETAALLESYGYQLAATADDLYMVYEANRSSAWVVDGVLTIDPVLEQWVQDSMEMISRGKLSPAELYSTDWNTGLYTDGEVFAYFLPVSAFNSRMRTSEETSVASAGGWAAAKGPGAFFWGDSCYLMAADGSDNLTLDAQVIRALTCDTENLLNMHNNSNMDVNSLLILQNLAASEEASKASMGGQNPYGVVLENALAINPDLISPYDSLIRDFYMKSMRKYLKGQLSYEEAAEDFRSAVKKRLGGLR